MKTTEVETKTTQGPWKVEKFQRDDGSGFAVTTADEDKTVVAWLYQYAPNSFGRMMRSEQDHQANARLIAAAPDLLAVLTMLHSYTSMGEWDMNTLKIMMSQAKEAIKIALE